MKTIKRLWAFCLTVLLVLFGAICFVGCDEIVIENKTGNGRLHGVWYLRSFTYDGKYYSTPEKDVGKIYYLDGKYPVTYDYMQFTFFEDGGVELSGKNMETVTGQLVQYRQKRGYAGNFTVDFILGGNEYTGVEDAQFMETQQLTIEGANFRGDFVRAKGSYAYDDLLQERQMQEIDFFDVKDTLQISDIRKIQVASYAGSVDPAHRQPTEYTVSEAEEEIALIYAWVSGMNDQTLTEISPQEMADGGGARILTVCTDFGTFTISELSAKVVSIGGKYFKYGASMPSITGEEATYRFDYSLDEALHFYKWGRFIKDYSLKLSEIVFRKTEHFVDMLDVGFMLKQDVGTIKLYSDTLFYHEGTGTYYEIVGKEDFSIIFSTNESLTEKDLENIELLKETYEAKTPNCGEAFVVNYYGAYGTNGDVIVAMMTGSNMNYDAAIWTETVAGHSIEYSDGNRIAVLYDGEFYTLGDAYDKGYLTAKNVSEIADKHLIFSYFYVIQ